MNDQKSYNHERVNFMLSPKHRHALDLMADDDRESMSTILRGLIVKEAKLRGLWLPVPQGDPTSPEPPPCAQSERRTLP